MVHNVAITRTAYELILSLDKINQSMTTDSLLGNISETTRELQRQATEKAHNLFDFIRDEWPHIPLEWIEETSQKP